MRRIPPDELQDTKEINSIGTAELLQPPELQFKGPIKSPEACPPPPT